MSEGNGAGLEEVVAELRTRNAQLELALSSRIRIEQAKGILAERYGLDMDGAFAVLRGASRRHRLRIHALAQEVVDSPRTPTAIEQELVRTPTASSASASRP